MRLLNRNSMSVSSDMESQFGISQYPLRDGKNDISVQVNGGKSINCDKHRKAIDSFKRYMARREEEEGVVALGDKTQVSRPVMPRSLKDKLARDKRIKSETKRDISPLV